MIVPFLFTFDEYSKEKPTHQWVANKFLDFCFKNHFPVILQEKYTKLPSEYKEKNHNSTSKKMQNDFGYEVLSNEEFKNIDIKKITKAEEKEILSISKSIDDVYKKILSEENKIFSKIIEKKIKEIEDSYQEKIEAIITWIWYPSLELVAKKHNIQVISYEINTFRPGKYRDTLGYFLKGCKYKNNEILNGYYKNKERLRNKLLLSNKEIISLFIDDEHATFINECDKNPEYEVGIAFGLKKEYFALIYDEYDNNKILESIEKYTPRKKISIRSHPANQVDESNYHYSFDHSFESIEWITKCRNIVCQVSNIGYEAILFNRGLISTNDSMITSFGKKCNLEYNDAKYYDNIDLNFLTFIYYAPYDLMFDVDYIRYRLSERDITKVYEYNMNHILKKYGLNINKLKRMNLKERFITILNTHNISDEEKQKIIRDAFEVNRYNELDREKDKLILSKEKTIDEIFNSRSWKILEKLRKLRPGK